MAPLRDVARAGDDCGRCVLAASERVTGSAVKKNPPYAPPEMAAGGDATAPGRASPWWDEGKRDTGVERGFGAVLVHAAPREVSGGVPVSFLKEKQSIRKVRSPGTCAANYPHTLVPAHAAHILTPAA